MRFFVAEHELGNVTTGGVDVAAEALICRGVAQFDVAAFVGTRIWPATRNPHSYECSHKNGTQPLE